MATSSSTLTDLPEDDCCQNRISVLPEEIWRMILNYLTSSTDRQNACQAFPMFNSLLHSKKVLWLFDLALPHIFKDLQKSDIISLRLVCKSWKVTVDKWVSGHPSLQPFSPKIFHSLQRSFNYLPLSTKFYDDLSFVNGRQFEEFLQTMSQHPRNPFFGRSIRIGSCGDLFDLVDEDIQPLWQGADNLCQKLGHHLWHVEFCNYEFSLSSLQFYRGIMQTLHSLPNLRSLHMNGALDRSSSDEDGQFLQFVELNPLPPLPHLDTLIFDMVLEQEVPSAILDYAGALPQDPDTLVEYLQDHPEFIQELLQNVPPCPDAFQNRFISAYGSQLQKLEISLQSWRPEYSNVLQNLTELHIKHVTDIVQLTTLVHTLSCANLGKLVLSLRCSIKTSQLIGILAPLKIICMDFGYLGEAPENYLVEDPNPVETSAVSSVLFLRLKDSTKINFEFLRNFPSLQHLDVWECQNAHSSWTDQASKVQKDNGTITWQLRRLIYQSVEDAPQNTDITIWTLLPSLKMITYRTRSGVPLIINRFSKEGYSWKYACSY